MPRPKHRARIIRTAQEAIVEDLKGKILDGSLPPAAPLRQGEIAAELGVSTTPVREALRQLAAEGLVDGDPHKGMWVHSPTTAEVDEIYRLIIPLEQMAMEEAAGQFTTAAQDKAMALIAAMDAEVDTAAWVELNLEFHHVLLDAAQMPVLGWILRRLRNLSSIHVASSIATSRETIDRARLEHRDLLDALVRQDGAEAARIATAHLEATHRLRRTQLAAKQT